MTVTYLPGTCPACNADSPGVTRVGDSAKTHCCQVLLCPMCGGSGSVDNNECDVCNGEGYNA